MFALKDLKSLARLFSTPFDWKIISWKYSLKLSNFLTKKLSLKSKLLEVDTVYFPIDITHSSGKYTFSNPESKMGDTGLIFSLSVAIGQLHIAVAR